MSVCLEGKIHKPRTRYRPGARDLTHRSVCGIGIRVFINYGRQKKDEHTRLPLLM